MANPKKKLYLVACVVDMCAEHVERILVRATNPALAMKKAESILRMRRYFHVRAHSCKEMETDG